MRIALFAAVLLIAAPAWADSTDDWNRAHSYTHYGDQQSEPQHWGDTPYSNMVAPVYRDQPVTDWNAMVPPAARGTYR